MTAWEAKEKPAKIASGKSGAMSELEAKRASGLTWKEFYAAKRYGPPKSKAPPQTGNEVRLEPGVEKKTTKSQVPVTFPTRFRPRFWDDADSRIAVVRLVRTRYQRLKEDCGADSVQKEMLAQRAIFLALVLETMEVNCLEGNGVDVGVFTQATNALSGLLKTLGLSKHLKNVTDLSTYLDQKRKGA